MKEDTNERLKLMHKHAALRLLWQMGPDGCTKAFPAARAGGVAGLWELITSIQDPLTTCVAAGDIKWAL